MKSLKRSHINQKKEIDSCRQQLTKMRTEATQKLFMTMRSHKIDYDVIKKSAVIDPEFKQVRYSEERMLAKVYKHSKSVGRGLSGEGSTKNLKQRCAICIQLRKVHVKSTNAIFEKSISKKWFSSSSVKNATIQCFKANFCKQKVWHRNSDWPEKFSTKLHYYAYFSKKLSTTPLSQRTKFNLTQFKNSINKAYVVRHFDSRKLNYWVKAIK